MDAADRDGGFVAVGPRVEELLTLQQEFFGQLDALGERQTSLVEEERTGELLELLGQRQRLIDGIAEIGTMLEPFRARWGEVMDGLPDEMRDRVRQRVDLLATLAARIAQRDEVDRQNLERRREQIARELSQMSRGRGALAAYGLGPRVPARFQDREA